MTNAVTEKYELIREDRLDLGVCTLYRIRALRDIPGVVNAGELGGYISGPESLSQAGNCWVTKDAKAFDGAEVRDNAVLWGTSFAASGAIIKDNARLNTESQAFGKVLVANNENVRVGERLLNTTILASSHFVQEGMTNFTFRYQSGRVNGAISIPVSVCDSQTAIELSLRAANHNLALYLVGGKAQVFNLEDTSGYLPYAAVLKYLEV